MAVIPSYFNNLQTKGDIEHLLPFQFQVILLSSSELIIGWK